MNEHEKLAIENNLQTSVTLFNHESEGLWHHFVVKTKKGTYGIFCLKFEKDEIILIVPEGGIIGEAGTRTTSIELPSTKQNEPLQNTGNSTSD